QWIQEIKHHDASRKENAMRTIVLFGPELAQQAVPVIVAELKKGTPSYPLDTSIRVNGPIALGVIVGGLKDPDPKYVKMPDVVGALTRGLRDSQTIVKFRAAEAVGRIGPQAIAAKPYLLSLLQDQATWELRQVAAAALGTVAFDKEKGPDPD